MPHLARYRPHQPRLAVVACLLNHISAQQNALDSSCALWQNLDMPEASTAQTEPIQQLSRAYAIPQQDQVRALVEDDQESVDALIALADFVRRVFSQPRLVLGTFADPEEDMEPCLVVTIQTNIRPCEAVKQRAELYDSYWSDYLMRHEQKDIMLSLDYLASNV